MKIYAFSGLGADKRVFDYLNLTFDVEVIDWIEPKKAESIQSYAKRLVNKIDSQDKIILVGLSFGGIVAVELSRLIPVELVILISSFETTKDLRYPISCLGKLKINRLFPAAFYNNYNGLIQYLFGAKNKALLKLIIEQTDVNFAEWAINQLVNWNNEKRVDVPILKISGNSDKLLPVKPDEKTIMLDKGEHFMIVDNADDLSQIINEETKKLKM